MRDKERKCFYMTAPLKMRRSDLLLRVRGSICLRFNMFCIDGDVKRIISDPVLVRQDGLLQW